MQATLPYRQPKKIASQRPVLARPPAPPNSAVAEEIFSFIAMRDLLLAEAEEHPTEASLHRVWMANEFAERCLEPARPPYQEQSLPEAEAVFERRRCKDVKTRLARLRTRVHSAAA
ncbi:MAG: hypothetical protein H0X40_03940 [Chthoniobacterales bacterium]|nr:hypothetical protein [Chthoniobacterales bacterium]